MRKSAIFILALAALLASSCGTYKRLGYLQDMETDVTYSMPLQPDAIIAKGDRLAITVACSTPELAKPFNILSGVSPIDPTGGDLSSGGSSSSSTSSGDASKAESSEVPTGYLVDNKGDIDFPVLGKLHVEGMTLLEVKDKIESTIIKRRFIKDPVVVICFTNFKVTFLGATGVSVLDVPDGRMDIFKALALTGDLKEFAQRDEIWVVRTVDGKRRLYTLNLKSKDCYYSPAFFLQQNDMVYAKYMDTYFDQTIGDRWTVINSLVGVIGTTINALLWFKYFTN